MAIQTINIGQNANDGTGDDLRTAFDKVNDNFDYLGTLGGETNTASNLTGVGEGVFAQKVDQDLQFKKIRSANSSTLTVTSDGTSIILNNLSPDQAAFRRVQDDAGNTITAQDANGIFGIKGGTNINTSVVGTNLTIDAILNIITDTTPQLGGNLDLNGNDIVGLGNMSINGFIRGAYFKGDLRGSVYGDDSSLIIDGLNNTLHGALTGSLTGNVTGNVTGDITGNVIGGLGSDLNLNTYALVSTTSGSALSGSASRVNLALGYDLGGGYPSLTNPLSDVEDAAWLIRMNDNDSPEWEFQGTLVDEPIITANYTHYITSGSVTDGYGQWMSHSYKNDTGDVQTMGFTGYSRVNGKNVWQAIPAKTGTSDFYYAIQANEDGVVTLDTIQISDEEITTTRSNENLKLNANGTGTIDFYGLYRFPKSLGQAGQVLKVGTSGNLLEWGTGGGGSSTTAISGATQADPVVITTTDAHSLVDNQQVTITDVVGMTELNGNSYYVDVLSSTTVALYTDDALSTTVDGTAYTAYTSGGYIAGGAGSGSSSFVGLSDTPSSYASAAADANKFVTVNGVGNGLTFTDYNSVIDATYIEGKGFLPKSGGTMSGNLDLDSNDITNGGTITATQFSGPISGNVTGNVTAGNIQVGVTGTNEIDTTSGNLTIDSAGGTVTVDDNLTVSQTLNVSTIDTTDSSAITVVPGVTMNSFLTVESSLEVLDTVTTTDLSVTRNTVLEDVTINGTLNVAEFNTVGTGTPTFTSGSDIVFDAVGEISTNVPVVPNADNTLTLGTASFKWANTYSTTFTGNLTGNVTGNVSGNVTGNVTAGNVQVGVTATGEIDTSSGNLTIDSAGGTVTVDDDAVVTGTIDVTGNATFDSVVALSGTNDLTITASATPATISNTNSVTFVTTNDYTGVGADLAYANLANGTEEGQIKIIKVVSRGQYSTDSVTFFDRYLQVNLTINGASGTLNVSENSEYGATTLMWHGSSWYQIGKVDS